ncbi:MAG: glycosyltransferase family 4 protein [Acidobacteriota bacterium]|nr:glycosyltransferase family 4 protein [Acidobacteriota bacterium]
MTDARSDRGAGARVLHVVPALFERRGGVVGGAERYALELARHMADEVPTALVTFGDEGRSETVGNLRVRVVGGAWYVRGQRTNPLAPGLFAELRRADVVHCHQHHVLASSLAALACRLTGRAVFATDLGGGGWDVSGYVSTDRWFHGHLHISEYSREVSGHGADARARVILGGVDAAKFSPDESVARDGQVLFVGRLLPHKGVDDLVRALPEGWTLEVIGQPYSPEYVRALERLAEGKRLVLRHDCDDAALVRAYREAMCVVLPSVYRDMYGNETRAPELLGQTLLEGMACGAPAVCTGVAAMPEVVEDGVTGFVVPPNDPAALREKIRWLREHPAEAARMGRAGRRRVLEKFTWPAVVRRCLESYAAAGRTSSRLRAERQPSAGGSDAGSAGVNARASKV